MNFRLSVFENRALRRISAPRRDKLTGGWIKLHNKQVHYLHFSPSIIRLVKSRRMIWEGHVPKTEMRNAYRLLVGKPEKGDH
jgi:hypothetical protein